MSDSGDAKLVVLEELFREFAEESASFSRRIARDAFLSPRDVSSHVAQNLKVARSVFGKWSIEVMVVLYEYGGVRFSELKRQLHGVSPRILSLKLRKLEEIGLVRRVVVNNRPPTVLYELTDEGRMVAKIGEPIFLYFGLVKRFYT
jgi:DNA-binding HxlR family transcriptional regulator